MSQQELGKKVGYAKSTISEIESGKYAPSTAQIPGLASALCATIEELFEGVR